MYQGVSIAVLMPCLNEAEGLPDVIPRIPSIVDKILIVDNGSTDGSATVARQLGARVIHEQRRGYGRVYLTGLPAVSSEVIVTLDSDGSYPVECVEPLVAELLAQDLDFITCSRFPLTTPEAMSRVSCTGNWLLTAACNLLFGFQWLDSQSGMWVIRRRVLAQLHLTQSNNALSEEIKLEAFRHLGARARERPIPYHPRTGKSKLRPLTDGWDCLWFLIRKRLGWVRACRG